MINHEEAGSVRPLTLAWVGRQLDSGERIVKTEALHGGITAEMRRLTIRARNGGTRSLVLRTFVDPFFVEHAEDLLNREADALTLLTGTDVPTPAPVAVDHTAAHCEYPSLLMTHLPGRTVLDDEGLEARVPLLARQLVAIHALRPSRRPREYEAWTTADTVVPPRGADAVAWAAAIDVIRKPAPSYEGRFLHRDFYPGNVLFDVSPDSTAGSRITGVVDWVQNSWGPADLDVAHCSTNLALLHQPRAAPRPGLGSAVRRGVREGRRDAGHGRERAVVLATAGRTGVRVRCGVGGTAVAGSGEDRTDDAGRGGTAGRLCHRLGERAGLSLARPGRAGRGGWLPLVSTSSR